MLSSIRLAVNGDALCLAALAASGLGILLAGALRNLRPARLWWPAGGWLLASAGFLAFTGRLPAAATLAGLLILAGAGGLLAVPLPAGAGRARPGQRLDVLILLAALVATGAILFPRLGEPSRPLQAWEPDVLHGLETEMLEGTPPLAAVTGRLLWRQGLLSTGCDSLFYGLPTFLLLSGHEASVLSLRLVAALLALASLILGWAVARHLFGAGVAAGTALVWLLAPPVLLYGRYGTSVTAMWASLWLALWAVLAFLSRPSTGRASLAALALYAATLQYAPGRVVAVGLLALAAVALPWAGGAGSVRARAGLVAAALAIAAIGVNARVGRLFTFYDVRGEQILGFRRHADVFEEYLARPTGTALLPWADVPALALRVAKSNLGAFREVVTPVSPLAQNGEAWAQDPPRLPLLLRTVFPVALWGLALSLREAREPRHRMFGLLAVFLLACAALLLTNRVDVARASCLLPFLALWGGRGAADLLERLGRTAGRLAAATAAGLFLVGGAVGATSAILPPYAPRSAAGESLLAALRETDGPFRIGVSVPRVQLGGAWLEALDRLHRRGERVPALLPPAVVDRIARCPEDPAGVGNEVAALVGVTPLLLGPSGDFAGVKPCLAARGLEVEEAGTEEFPLLRIRASPPAARRGLEGGNAPGPRGDETAVPSRR